MTNIRSLFSRQIDRQIEKVIDYYADDETRLSTEISEYEATENVEACFRKFLEMYHEGIQVGQVTEVGIWVSGFYGSGKSSFTKYLGFALDPDRMVVGKPFLELLRERLRSSDVQALLTSVSNSHPTAVVMLDLGTEQLGFSTATPVTDILYWKVLQMAGYSKEKKLARLEYSLTQKEMYDDFKSAYQQNFGEAWEAVHNDPLLGVARASQLLPQFMPQDFPEANSFLALKFEMTDSVRDLARRMIEVVRQMTGRENILFLIDEAGQYVAPRGELILNLDGLARTFKEVGGGKVWVVATGQQTLTEIVERAALNTPELNKLRDRFPISIELDARDIREITYRRLLTKRNDAELRKLFNSQGQAMITHTRLTSTAMYKGDPTADDFVRFYPFLPQHFEVLMEFIRVLASRTGGLGLRSAIRVIQDVLVDTSRILPPDEAKLADRKIGTLATVADFYKTLRVDINKTLPHIVTAVDKVEAQFAGQALTVRVAYVVGALQVLENFPRTAENVAALLYPELGSPAIFEDVRKALSQMVEAKEIGLIEDPQTGGYQFLSENVGPLTRKRNEYVPATGELARVRNEVLQLALSPQPRTRLENVKDVVAGVRIGRTWLLGDREDIVFQLEMISDASWESKRQELLSDTTLRNEYRNTIIWLYRRDETTDASLEQIRKSEYITEQIEEHNADKDVAQYVRSERRLAETNRGKLKERFEAALLGGTFIFRGRPTPVRQKGETLEIAARLMLSAVAKEVFHQFHLVKVRPNTNLAAQFLSVEHLNRMPGDRDPLKLVTQQGNSMRVDVNHPALAETLRAFKEKLNQSGGGRLPGSNLQDYFAADPYGWSKDAVRYLFSALLVAGEVEFHSGDVLKNAGPAAVEAVKSTLAFNRVGVGLRDSKVSLETLDRAARRLQDLFGETVHPLENEISQAARKYLPEVMEKVGALPDRLRLLNLPGERRASNLLIELGALLRGDASDAPSRMGMPDATIIDDVQWARAATEALDQHGEADIMMTNALISGLAEIEQLFPGVRARLVSLDEMDRLQDILGAESFHEQLPDLRGVVRAIHQLARESYAAEYRNYQEELKAVRIRLENRADWTTLEPDDREAIAGRLILDLPETPSPEAPLTEYKTMLARQRGLPALASELEAEIARLQPAPTEAEADVVETLTLRKMHPLRLITSEADLETWLGELRALLLEHLRSGKQIRFED